MWSLAVRFPDQLLEGWGAVRQPLPGDPRMPVVVVGMGGSGIAGDVVAALSSQEGQPWTLPMRGFELPGWVRPPVRAIFVSYSGNTRETLEAFGEARRRGVLSAVVTSGGRLGRWAENLGIPWARVPSGQPPRASLGHLLGALLGLLRDSFPPGTLDLSRTATELRQLWEGPEGLSARARSLAEFWGDGWLWVYTSERLGVVGRRWKSQSEENAKRLGHFDTLPEFLHNAIVAWDVADDRIRSVLRPVLLRGPRDSSAHRIRFDYFAEFLRQRHVNVWVQDLRSREPLGEILEGMWLGDATSLHWCDQHGIDPYPVPPIDRMKRDLEAQEPPLED
jgi:glucose/mannose-6-phosphate isomerase